MLMFQSSASLRLRPLLGLHAREASHGPRALKSLRYLLNVFYSPKVMVKDITVESFPTTVHELQYEIERIAVELKDWAVYNPGQKEFLMEAWEKRYRQHFYREFSIPKKSGGLRTITAPSGYLKGAQRAIAVLLKSVYTAPESVHGFTDARSVKTNAEPHVGKRYVFNTDLKDYFPSITWKMVYDALLTHGIEKDVAKYICTVCTITVDGDDLPEDVLPQGSPASPILSNMVCLRMDVRLEWLARRHGLTYTRYADDMTFSSQYSAYARGGDFQKEFREVISRYGFTLNEEKTRVQKCGSCQEVTGITVCEKPNVSRKYVKNLRAELFHMEMHGFCKEQYKSVRGKIAFVGMIRGIDDPLFLKLSARIRSIRSNPQGFLASR